MDYDSTQLQPPALGPIMPIYPDLCQLVQVTGPNVGGNIYPGLAMQFAPPLGLRAREPCYLYEPNGSVLFPVPGVSAPVYDCRLIASYQGLPLYATACCPTGGGSSSSSMSPTPFNVLRTALGSVLAGSTLSPVTTATLSGLVVPNNCLLVAVGAAVGTTPDVLTWGPYTLSMDADATLPAGAALLGGVGCFSATITTGGTHDLVLTAAAAGVLALQAAYVLNLFDDVPDQSVSSAGLGTQPDAGATGRTTAQPEYVQGGFLLLAPSGGGAWQNGFASGGQDVSGTVGGVSVKVTEGWMKLSTLQTVHAALSGLAGGWAGACATYY